MKLKKYLLGLIFASLLCSGNTYAGHIIHKTNPLQEHLATKMDKSSVQQYTNNSAADNTADTKSAKSREGDNNNHKKDTSGWEGIVAISLGILGLFTFGLTSIPAIIFGAIGLGKGKQHRGMSMAGMILGIVTVFLVVGMAVLISSFYL